MGCSGGGGGRWSRQVGGMDELTVAGGFLWVRMADDRRYV